MRARLSVIPKPKPFAAWFLIGLSSITLVLLGCIWFQSARSLERLQDAERLEEQNVRLVAALDEERALHVSTPSVIALEELRARVLRYNALAPSAGLVPSEFLDALESALRSDTRLSELYYNRKDAVLSLALASEEEASLLSVLDTLQEAYQPYEVQLVRQLMIDGQTTPLVQFDIRVEMR